MPEDRLAWDAGWIDLYGREAYDAAILSTNWVLELKYPPPPKALSAPAGGKGSGGKASGKGQQKGKGRKGGTSAPAGSQGPAGDGDDDDEDNDKTPLRSRGGHVLPFAAIGEIGDDPEEATVLEAAMQKQAEGEWIDPQCEVFHFRLRKALARGGTDAEVRMEQESYLAAWGPPCIWPGQRISAASVCQLIGLRNRIKLRSSVPKVLLPLRPSTFQP